MYAHVSLFQDEIQCNAYNDFTFLENKTFAEIPKLDLALSYLNARLRALYAVIQNS